MPAPHGHDPSAFLVLHVLSIRGRASEEAIQTATALPAHVLEENMSALQARGYVEYHERPVGGWALTSDGKVAHLGLLDEGGIARSDKLAAKYEEFLQLNGSAKEIFTKWQVRTDLPGLQSNDHKDARYDTSVIAELRNIHLNAVRLIEGLAEEDARFHRYVERLCHAHRRIEGGDPSAVARPLSESYHDIWMELHQDLLLCLGRSRSVEDGY